MTPDQSGSFTRRTPNRYLRALSSRSSLESVQFGGLESATGTADELVKPAVRQEHLDRLSRAFAKADRGEKPPQADLQRTRNAVLRQADAALTKLGRDRAKASLTIDDQVGLEAVIRLTGRPSILVKNGDLDLDSADPDLGPWQGTIVLTRDEMKRTIHSVGRIDRGFHIGTGFVVAPGLVMTNRHVLQDIAHETQRSNGSSQWKMLGGRSTIDFAMEYGSTRTSQFEITGVAFSGPAPIDPHFVDIAKLDLAMLVVETVNSDGEALPPPLLLSKSPATSQGMSEVYMVGYPARPLQLSSGGDPENLKLIDTLKRIFRMRYGFKRLSLGSITYPLGQVPNDPMRWAIGHDATTLGGNSGSCVVGLVDDGPVLGLHFGGILFDHNLAHVFAAVPALQAAPTTTLGLAWG